ncbi:MAG TPA: cytochrome c biogenesis protein CcdA [Planctomycetota bacterium]|nr:cytochrome c biogenesis protein CcdA [Planctomycetota bacterium]
MRNALFPLALMALCASALAGPTAKLRPDDADGAEPAPGLWFDLLLAVDPGGASIAADGLEAVPAPTPLAEFGAAIFPAPDAAGAYTKPFTVRVPVKLAASKAKVPLAVGLRGRTADGPLAVEGKAELRLIDWTPHAEATVALKAPAVAGKANAVLVSATVAEGFHVYGTKIGSDGIPMAGALLPAPGARGAVPWAGGEAASPPGKKYDRSVSFEIPFTPARGGKIELRVLLTFQACDENSCDPTAMLYLPLAFDASAAGEEEGASGAGPAARQGAKGAAGPSASGSGAAASGGSSDTGGLAAAGIVQLILLSIGAGIFALLMPCTYPLIPITISFFSKQAESRHKGLLPLALAYGAGIVVIFTAIGGLVGGGLAAADSISNLANVWWLNFLFALLFLVFGLSLVGLFDIRLPSAFDNVAARASGTGGYLSVFAMGLTLVITSFTCTAPFVGSLLVYSAKGGQVGATVLCMATFGLTMAVPFVILAMSPKAFQAMPRSGEWMKRLKVTLGIVELGLVLKFLSNVDIATGRFLVGRQLFLVLWSVSFLAAGFYLLGVFDLFGKGPRKAPGAGRVLAGLLMLGLTGILGYGATGPRLGEYIEAFLPSFEGEYNRAFVAVIDDYEKGVEIAKQKDAFIFLHFTGFQ